jgi:hypothetical protein
MAIHGARSQVAKSAANSTSLEAIHDCPSRKSSVAHLGCPRQGEEF